MHHYQRVHLEAQIDMGAGLAIFLIEQHVTFVIGMDTTEPVDVGGHIAFTESMLGEFNNEAVLATQRPVIAVLLVGLAAPAFLQGIIGEVAADGIVPADSIFNDGAKDTAHVRIQAMPAR